MHPLTGNPAKQYNHDEIDKLENLWKLIKHSDDEHFVMACAVSSSGEVKSGLQANDMKDAGLVDDHAYSLLGT